MCSSTQHSPLLRKGWGADQALEGFRVSTSRPVNPRRRRPIASVSPRCVADAARQPRRRFSEPATSGLGHALGANSDAGGPSQGRRRVSGKRARSPRRGGPPEKHNRIRRQRARIWTREVRTSGAQERTTPQTPPPSPHPSPAGGGLSRGEAAGDAVHSHPHAQGL